jgi:broad specificity phosphatase PhoE
MSLIRFITHPDVTIDPAIPVTDWPLSPTGRERMTKVFARPWISDIRAIVCSSEQKAIDGATILADGLRLPFTVRPGLHENDRTATGYLPKAEFESVANQFFANPDQSIRGWERAMDAQRRIISAVKQALHGNAVAGDLAIVSHGGVGALLLCHLLHRPISRDHDQPANNGGNYFTFDADTWRLSHGWRSIDAEP